MNILTKSVNELREREKVKRYLLNQLALGRYFVGLIGELGICPESRFVDGYVEGKRKYRKVIPCGRESCRVCGREGSLLHRQRFARGLDKILGAVKLGYWVFTFPLEVRGKLKSKEVLGRFTSFVRDLLKGYAFIKGGVTVWHYGGDKHRGWHPHLNVLTNQAVEWVSSEVISEVKERVREWISQNLGEVSEVVVEYRYCKNKGQRVHKWRYVCRPTLRLCGDEVMGELIQVLHNFRNIRWWGKWERVENLPEAVRVLNGDEKVEWIYGGDFSKVMIETFENCEYLGAGIFKFVDDS